MNNTRWALDVFKRVGAKGPMPYDYAATILSFEHLYRVDPNGSWPEDLIIEPHKQYLRNLQEELGTSWNLSKPYMNLVPHIWDKPKGYAGDHELLEKLYRGLDSQGSDKDGIVLSKYQMTLWDYFILSRPEVLSLQNRKAMFFEMAGIYSSPPYNYTSVLDVGCGIGEFSKELYHKMKWQGWKKIHGVDNDAEAIAKANRTLPLDNGEVCQLTFTQKNAALNMYFGDFDWIYAGGLFDYFSDEVFVKVLKRLQQNHNPKAMMIGNINQGHPTKCLMSSFGWNLHDRSPHTLAALGAHLEPKKLATLTDITGCQNFLLLRF